MLSSSCNFCFQTTRIVRISDEIVKDGLHVCIGIKLQYLVPEVDWSEQYTICEQCINELLAACKFREQCFKLKDFKDEINYECLSDVKPDYQNDSESSNDTGVLNRTENSSEIFICYHCNQECKAKTDLIKHIETEHQNPARLLETKYKRQEKCSKCGRRYVSSASLKEHEIVCDGVRRHSSSKAEFQCTNCGKFYTTRKILNAHKPKCNFDNLKKTNFQCTKCNRYYKNVRILKKHQKIGCKQDVVFDSFCKICGDQVRAPLSLEEHIAKYHLTNLQCNSCNLKFCTIQEHDCHKCASDVTTTEEIKKFSIKFTCELCGEKFRFLRKIIDHCVKVHSMDKNSVRPYECEICNSRFRTSTNLINHRLYHQGERANVCSFCGKSFITKHDLAAHERTHFSLRKYKCDKCDKAFKTNTNLRTHTLIVHTDSVLWKYVCYICNKRFPQKSNHDQHVRRHLGEKNFVCSFCNKGFASKSEMQEHIGHHSNLRAHKCDLCGKEYRKKYTYNVHRTKVHGVGSAKLKVRERKYSCHICPGKFYDKAKLARHLCVHSGLKPYSCSNCEKKFTDKYYLKHHLITVHNVDK